MLRTVEIFEGVHYLFHEHVFLLSVSDFSANERNESLFILNGFITPPFLVEVQVLTHLHAGNLDLDLTDWFWQ